MQILVADADHLTVQCLAAILTPVGHDLVSVADGTAALRAVETSPPDLILTELWLPGGSGIRLAQQLYGHANAAVAQIPIVAMSASVTLLALGRPALFTSLLPKPVHLDEVRELVAAVAAQRTRCTRVSA